MNGERDLQAARRAAIERLGRGATSALLLRGHTWRESVDVVQAVFPGAFNPLHDGHRRMARVAGESLGAPVAFELSIENVDKPPLDLGTIELRLSQFDGDQTICLTRAATFVEKVQLFGSANFVVGADTILRIADARYYGDDASQRDGALETIVAAGAQFFVFGRTIGRRFQTLSQLAIPDSLRAICREVRETEFRHDISSTEIRSDDSANA